MIISKRNKEMPTNSPYDVKCTISYSAPLEELFSLNTLVEPSSHPDCENWAKNRLSKLSKKLRDEILFFSEHYAKWIFATDLVESISVGLSPSDCTVAHIAAYIKEMSPVDFAYIFLGFAAFHYDKDKIQAWYENPETITTESLGEQQAFFSIKDVVFFFQHADRIKKRLVWVMEAYWQQSFQYDWIKIEDYLSSHIHKEYAAVSERGAISYIQKMHPNIAYKEGKLIFQKNPDFFINVKEVREINISLSLFIGSNLAVNIIGNKLYLTKNLSFQSALITAPIPPDLISITKSLGDETRLKMLKVFWSGRATTQSLSEYLHLSPSAVSMHLKQLKRAKLVDCHKEKKYVYYYLNPQTVNRLQRLLMQYLED